ncbi:uncharacterized protein VP01_3897g1 [Puccinia sorghi]|uniref:Uncharacterized protein n=1 Tax=Puccinia sorghi TaxID=27349 RepID=A0A0L6USR1_9BASI|nr:uncharacterized protein VP01_3897g1 [Puccinia sorghi]
MPKKVSPKPTKPTTKNPAIQRKFQKNRVNNSSEDDTADKTAALLEQGRLLLLVIQQKVKINGFEIMSINLRNQSPSKINLTPCQMKD